jgi:hypothetical protein
MDDFARSWSGEVEKDYFSSISSFTEGLFDQRTRATTVAVGIRPAKDKE